MTMTRLRESIEGKDQLFELEIRNFGHSRRKWNHISSVTSHAYYFLTPESVTDNLNILILMETMTFPSFARFKTSIMIIFPRILPDVVKLHSFKASLFVLVHANTCYSCHAHGASNFLKADQS